MNTVVKATEAENHTAPTITGCILARNEEGKIADALQSLLDWTDQIIVLDNESVDSTAKIAGRFGALVIPVASTNADVNFDALRNIAIEHATSDWVFYLDADERVPPGLGATLKQIVAERGHEFDAMLLPFKHYFCGKWMQHCNWWPGYTRPQLLKKGRFRYNERLHSGVDVEGRTMRFPADDPNLAIIHYSYDSLDHYLRKLNRYTDGEAENLLRDGANHSWRAQIAHFALDWSVYYDAGNASGDGMHGFVLAFLSAFYRFASRAKLYETRFLQGLIENPEPVPTSVAEVLDFLKLCLRVPDRARLLLQPGTFSRSDMPPRLPVDPEAVFVEITPDAQQGELTIPRSQQIVGCIVARNEEARIENALRSLKAFTDKIIVVDNESTDATAAIASQYADVVLAASGEHLEDIRSELAEEIHAAAFESADWIFYLDADERVPLELGQEIRRLVREEGDTFDALGLPFQNYFYGKWMQSPPWWPGYKGVQLYRRGTFEYPERIHQPTKINGTVRMLPQPPREGGNTGAVLHTCHPTIHKYLEKLNYRTNTEAQYLLTENAEQGWRAQIEAFIVDWRLHYDHLDGKRDGMHGFIQSFLCAMYRYVSRAKLWDLRRQLPEDIHQMPSNASAEQPPRNLLEVIHFAERILTGVETKSTDREPVSSSSLSTDALPGPVGGSKRLPLVWRSPLFGASGFADEARNFVLGLIQAGEPVALEPESWGEAAVELSLEERMALEECIVPANTPVDILVTHTITPLIPNSANHARYHVIRTMFETDRLPLGLAPKLQASDRIWVPSEFNRQTFSRAAGIELTKIAVIPEALDFERFADENIEPWPLPGSESFRFLSVFDWTLHKGWDVLLDAFIRAFDSRKGSSGADSSADIGLVIKTWSSQGYSFAQIRNQADSHLRETFGRGLQEFPNIHLWNETIPVSDMPRVYRAAQAFVLPTRGEGWCRPLMEAMAAGLPTIATAWSGLTEFHDAQVGYPLRCTEQVVSAKGAREISTYAGHQWAEPDLAHLRALLRQVAVRYREAARRKGKAAQERIGRLYNRIAVAQIVRDELAFCRNESAKKPDHAENRGIVLEEDRRKPQTTAAPVANRRSDAILIQSAQGKHEQLLDLSAARHTAYTRLHHIDFVTNRSPVAGAAPSPRHPHWDKIALILRALDAGYEYVVWLDADTLIADTTVDIRRALPPGKWLGMVQHRKNDSTAAWFNSGALYVRNTQEARDFLQQVWNYWPVEHHWEDNLAILLVIAQNPERWSLGIARLDDRWNSTRLMNEVTAPIVMAWHGSASVAESVYFMEHALQSLEAETLRLRQKPEESNRLGPDHGPLLWPRANPIEPNTYIAAGQETPVDFVQILGHPLRLRWDGDQSILTSLAHVNRELCLRLLDKGDVNITAYGDLGFKGRHEISLLPAESARFAGLFERLRPSLGAEQAPYDITVRHHWPPNWARVSHGKLVVIQPWELSHLPRHDWITGASQHADQVWAYSRFVRDVYARSGVPAERVKIVPLGVRTDVFSPHGSRLELSTQKTVRFLFVGGTTDRKGADLLLEAYLRGFRRSDDVCLVVKDMGAKTFYRGQNFSEAFRQAQADPQAPEIVYIDDDLSEADLASLYRACTCTVLPFRGEGFGLAPLEGMACGLPAIVTAGGPADDYLDDTVALRVPYRQRIRRSQYRGIDHCAVDPWDLDPDMDALIEALRWVYSHPSETAERGRLAHAHVEANWTWDHSAAIARRLLGELVSEGQHKDINASQHFSGATAWTGSIQPVPVQTGRQGKSKSRTIKGTVDTKSASGSRLTVKTPTPASIELSLCMIVRDEESRIGACLESIRPFVDEMIVVDTGSTDRTREIARDAGAQVFDFAWTDSFAEARNQSLDQAHGRWIFWMDADDTISPESGLMLRQLVRSHPEANIAFQAQVRIPPGAGEFSESIVDHVKLFPNRPDLRFEHRIHEQILPALRAANIPIEFSDVFVTHSHYDRSPEGQAKKRQRDFRLLGLDLRDRPDHPFVLFNLGMTHLFATHDYEVAAQYLERSIAGSHWRDSIVGKAYALLTTARMQQQDWSLAIQANENGRRHYPDDVELLYQAGQIYQQVGDFDRARLALERLVGQGQVNGSPGTGTHTDAHYRSVDTALSTYRGRFELALLHRKMGDGPHCVQILRDILREAPTFQPAQQELEVTLQMMAS